MPSNRNKTDVAKTPGAVIDIDRRAKAKAIWDEAVARMTRPEQTPEEMMLAILEAETAEDVFAQGATSLQDMIGVPFTIRAAWLSPSTIEGDGQGLPSFVVMDVEYDDRTSGIVTTGATACVSACIRWEQLGAFPYRVSSEEKATNTPGRTVKRFIKPLTERPTQEQLAAF